MSEDQKGGGMGLLLAWAFVGIPLIWGVVMTVRNAMALFQ